MVHICATNQHLPEPTRNESEFYEQAPIRRLKRPHFLFDLKTELTDEELKVRRLFMELEYGNVVTIENRLLEHDTSKPKIN